ncbi:MAG: efflux RND transporter periplasmic adaptor subunit, partial [Sinobacteraceae bacterium]|nr:efflux RND transporter periplasmic adaptor subunit [Nevskiaceae bacterium]
MKLQDHEATPRGRAFLWGGIGLGVLLMLVLMTKGFGLLANGKAPVSEQPSLVHQGEKIVVPEHSALRTRLTVALAQAEVTSRRLELPGIVESDPARTAAVLSPAAGRVLEIKVALGDRVRQGQVLATIDSPDLAQAYDDTDKAADALQLAEKNLERQVGQFKLGTASTRDLDQARSDRTQAAAEHARTQARLRVLGVPPESQHRSRVLSVTAPVSGSITALGIARGNMVNDPTQPLMTVADLSTVWVTALAPEKDLGAVAKDQDADVYLAAYPGKVLHGKVLFVSDVIEADSRRDKLRIAFQNADSALKPNMFATVALVGEKQ